MRFCGGCGQRIVASTLPESAPAPPPSRPAPKQTMMGMPALEGALLATEGVDRGQPMPFVAASRRASHATLHGMPAAAEASIPAPSLPTEGRRAAQATLHGMPAASRALAAPAPAVAEASPPPGALAPAARLVPASASPIDPGAAGPRPPQPSRDRAEPKPSFSEPRARVAVTYDDRLAKTQAARPPARPWLAPMLGGALVTFALLGLAVVAYFVHRGSTPDVRARMARASGQESLVVEVPSAAPGTHVRFGEVDRALEGGRAVFSIPNGRLVVGDNPIELELVGPDGEARALTTNVAVAYRVFPDLEGLDEAPPRLRVRVIAPPRTMVELGGAELRLDAEGRGFRDFPVDGARDEHSLLQTVSYRILPPGGSVEAGEVRARLPFATLAIDRPGRALVTDRAYVEVEGAAQAAATVTVGGTVVPVVAGHFKHRVGLDELGAHRIEIMAREAGAVSHREVVEVRRVADLAAEAGSYPVDASLTYAAVAADPAAHRGEHVSFEGLVYNVEIHRGRSMLQVLVSHCGEARRCPLWVTYPAATEVELNGWVRVLGEVDGEQHFRTAGAPDHVVTVPRVRAVYVLPVTR
jgi:hypothetical protein